MPSSMSRANVRYDLYFRYRSINFGLRHAGRLYALYICVIYRRLRYLIYHNANLSPTHDFDELGITMI